jgi:hypothetical protein
MDDRGMEQKGQSGKRKGRRIEKKCYLLWNFLGHIGGMPEHRYAKRSLLEGEKGRGEDRKRNG